MAHEAKVNRRIKLLYLMIFGITLISTLFCIRWQVIKASYFRQIANMRVRDDDIKSLRGSIYTQDGTTLAYSEPRFDMFVWLNDLKFYEDHEIQTRDEFVNKIAPIIGTTPEELKKVIQENANLGVKWIQIGESLTEEQWSQLIDLKTDLSEDISLRGFDFEYTSKRIYPEGQLATHIVGLSNMYEDKIYGISGLEQAWDGDLSPVDGKVIGESDAAGNAVVSALIPTIEPKPGSEIYTSIDKKLQTLVERELKRIVEQYQAQSGSAVIMNYRTGEILALANFPTYDPNLREEKNSDVYGNIAISSPIEIGSVMKTITIAAAIDLGLITPDTVIMPEGHNGCKFYSNDLPGDGSICTWDKVPQPPMPVKDCFTKSDNICFVEVGQLIIKEKGREAYYDYLKKFGIGKSTGIDLAGESIGILKETSEWTLGDEAAFSYGHGFQVNAVQSLSAVSAIPNKGIRMKPHVVTKIVKADGEEIVQNPTPIERAVSEETALIVSNMMQNIYQNNIIEPYYQHLKEYPIGWKTGSALIADPNNPGCPYCSGDLYNSIVGFDASEGGTFIMIMTLEKPTGGLSFYNIRPAWLEMFNVVKDEVGVSKR